MMKSDVFGDEKSSMKSGENIFGDFFGNQEKYGRLGAGI